MPMPAAPLTVAWISDFPIEWLSDVPDWVSAMPKEHPATWAMVLLAELERDPRTQLHVVVVRRTAPRHAVFERNGVTFHVRKTPRGTRALSLFWMDTFHVWRVLRQVRPAVVHAWGHERGAGWIAARLGYPYLITIQGLLNWYLETIPLDRYARFTAFAERRGLARAKVVTTESSFGVQYLHQHYPHLTVHQVEHASNWLFHRVERRPRTDPIRFLALGSLAHRKGSDLLLRALHQMAGELPFELVVVGTPDEAFLAPLRAELPASFWSRVTFKRNLLPAQVADEIAAATIMVLPTRCDTSPNAVKESAVAGLPVVASAVGGIPDYIFPGENGLLFPPDSLEECTAAIRAAVRHPLFGKGLVDPARLEKARAYLSPALMARKFGDIYRSLATPAT